MKRSAPSRIINVSSAAKDFAKLDVEDLQNKKNVSKFTVYGNTKLANVLFTRELAERLVGTGKYRISTQYSPKIIGKRV